jgi:hypothetical protein
LTVIKTFEVVDLGVIETLKPVMSADAPGAMLDEVMVVKVVLWTCSTEPLVAVVEAM